jgi:sec-independent protein translocase protein TatC
MTTYTKAYDEESELEDQGSMSFLDHLDELRNRLIRSAIFILVAFVVCWAFSANIYNFLQVPVQAAMLASKRELALLLPNAAVSKLDQMPDGKELDFAFTTDCKIGEAIIQTGTSVRVKMQRTDDGTVQLATVRPVLINDQTIIDEGFIIPRDLYAPSSILMSPDNRLVVHTVQGGFNLYIKVAFYSAVFFAVPFILVQTWGFVSPGLYPHEKKYAAPFIIMTTLFFLAGCAFAYYIAFPRAANFLLGVTAGGNLRPLVTADDYFDLIITIMLGLGLVFVIPTVTFFLSRLGLITPRMLIKFWRLALIVIFIIAALLSPTTDVPNLLVFAAPMMFLYALSIGIAWVFYRKRQARESADS